MHGVHVEVGILLAQRCCEAPCGCHDYDARARAMRPLADAPSVEGLFWDIRLLTGGRADALPGDGRGNARVVREPFWAASACCWGLWPLGATPAHATTPLQPHAFVVRAGGLVRAVSLRVGDPQQMRGTRTITFILGYV